MKIIEFLYFYLMPEMSTASSKQAAKNGDVSRRSSIRSNAPLGAQAKPRRSLAGPGGHSRTSSVPNATSSPAPAQKDVKTDVLHRSTEEKQAYLERYLTNVQDLVGDLRESALFGGS
jgi:hypothetical protein